MAFRELLLDQGYGAVTIGAVAASANVGRSTFYEHYRTKDDLLRASLRGPFTTLAALVDTPSMTGAVQDLLQHFREHRQVARVLLGWPTRPLLAATLADLVAVRLHGLTSTRPLIPVELIARQIAEAQLALLDGWIAGRPAFGIEAAVDALEAASGALVKALCRH